MTTLYQILGILGAVMLVWVLYRGVKNRPELFTKDNMSKSFTTMGVLALLLIGFVALLILLVKTT